MSKFVLILYMTRGGHTARIARRIGESIDATGGRAETMSLLEADKEGVDWSRYGLVVVGAPVLYGTYDPSVFDFVARHRTQLEARPNAFFNVSVEGNRYMQKFLQLSPWRPSDLKVIAGKVDYPSWRWHERLMIRLIMKYTQGPTDPATVIDYTDWNDVAAYGRHLLTLAA
jgi:menaquinone-dependent protoporphyrinogen oxidase